MGNESSLPLELGATFDADEIKRLGKREGSISVEQDSQQSALVTVTSVLV